MAAASDEDRVTSAAGHDGALTFVLNGLSKIVGLPQLKLAWVHVNGPEDLRRRALEGLEFISDAYLSVSTPVQLGASAVLSQRRAIQAQILERLEENGRLLEEALSRLRRVSEILNREGGWYAIIRLPDDTSDEEVCVRSVEEDGVLVHPGVFLRFPCRQPPCAEPPHTVGCHFAKALPGLPRGCGSSALSRLQAGARDDIVAA